jgi:hypothetical protein
LARDAFGGTFFVDWQYASIAGDEPTDPIRSQ